MVVSTPVQPVMYQGTLFTRGLLYFNSTFFFLIHSDFIVLPFDCFI